MASCSVQRVGQSLRGGDQLGIWYTCAETLNLSSSLQEIFSETSIRLSWEKCQKKNIKKEKIEINVLTC